MTVLESLPVALFCMAMVFFVLACLFVLIKLFSFGIGVFSGNNVKILETLPLTEDGSEAEQLIAFSTGNIRLHNVDERTAAMIMAIVSDESGIPLSELCFKSIKAVENKITD